MISLSIIVILVILALTLGIMSVIGLFNKRVNGHVNLAFGFIRTLKVSWKNFWRLPSRFRLLVKVLPFKRGLLIRKVKERLKVNRSERRKRRQIKESRKNFREIK